MTKSDRKTRDNKKKDENLQFLLSLCIKETECTNCGIFLADPEKKSFQPLLTQKRSKDFEARVKSYCEKENLSEKSFRASWRVFLLPISQSLEKHWGRRNTAN